MMLIQDNLNDKVELEAWVNLRRHVEYWVCVHVSEEIEQVLIHRVGRTIGRTIGLAIGLSGIPPTGATI